MQHMKGVLHFSGVHIKGFHCIYVGTCIIQIDNYITSLMCPFLGKCVLNGGAAVHWRMT